MNRIERLEAEADRRRQDLVASLRKFRTRFSALGLADEALHQLDPERDAIAAAGRALRRDPLPAIPVLLGLGWLALNTLYPPRPKRRGRTLITSQKPKKEKDRRHEDDSQKTEVNQVGTQDGHTIRHAAAPRQ
jgi:hypothetical protein